MRAVMSLWTGTDKFKLTRGLALLFSASVAYAHRAFGDSELVTDLRGIQIADRLRWQFTSFSTVLQDFCTDNERHVWMLGKIKAQSIQPVPHIHVDMDAVIFHKFGDRILKARVAVQSKDHQECYHDPLTLEYMEVCGITPGTCAFNMGITLWNDLALRDEYCAQVFAMVERNAGILRNGTALSLVAEQVLFADFMRYKRVEVTEIIPMPKLCCMGDFSDCQFSHLWSDSKENGDWLLKIEKRFAHEFPEKYANFQTGWPQIERLKLAA